VKGLLMPLDEFPAEMRQEIERLASCETRPPRWIKVAGAEIPSRAWVEWNLRRGLRPDGERQALPDELRDRVVARDGMRCGICGGAVAHRREIHIDHIVPVALGGTNDLANLQVSHALCNMRKGARLELAEDER
jgi:5-methylcytosine-specific restriction endonuclease McrA